MNKKITVVTNSLVLALQLAASETIDIILCGGRMRKSALSLSAIFDDAILNEIRINKCFISSHGFTCKHGLTDMTVEECKMKREMLQHSDEVFVLLDSTKFNKHTAFVVCEAQEINTLITDPSANEDRSKKQILDECIKQGCRVIFAGDNKQ